MNQAHFFLKEVLETVRKQFEGFISLRVFVINPCMTVDSKGRPLNMLL